MVPDYSYPFKHHGLIHVTFLVYANDNTGWKRFRRHCFSFENDEGRQLSPICRASQHDSEAQVLIATGQVLHTLGAVLSDRGRQRHVKPHGGLIIIANLPHHVVVLPKLVQKCWKFTSFSSNSSGNF